jgi:hypothetical protein
MRPSPSIFTSGEFAARRSADLQIAWLDAADDAYESYLAWRDADRAERADAFAVYRAALDREEAAAPRARAPGKHVRPAPQIRLRSRARAIASARAATPSFR